MSIQYCWDRCISHRGPEAARFIADYFGQESCHPLLVVGAGFDPRSTIVCRYIGDASGKRAKGFFIREERPDQNSDLRKRAEDNLKKMKNLIVDFEVKEIRILAPDGAVVGSRKAAGEVANLSLDNISDVVVDTSSLSVGVSFPVVKQLLDRIERCKRKINLHVMVADSPATDEGIEPIACGQPTPIPGFHGGFGLDSTADAVKLWVPLLRTRRRAILEEIRMFVGPDDICPVLPFPAKTPRTADRLIEHYLSEFESTWEVDDRHIVYAAESNPLDLYRSLLRLDDARKKVFAPIGNSMMILSPLGNKALVLGSLMAALERDFPVVYMEATGYHFEMTEPAANDAPPGTLIHIWLKGEAYSSC